MRRRELDNREKDPAYVSDAYAECYPGYHEYAGTVVDSDEEDFTHMDGKEKGRSRIDFDTEEQWQVQNTWKIVIVSEWVSWICLVRHHGHWWGRNGPFLH